MRLGELTARRRSRLSSRPIPGAHRQDRALHVGIVGVGEWTMTAIQPDLRNLHDLRVSAGKAGLRVKYASRGEAVDPETGSDFRSAIDTSWEAFYNVSHEDDMVDFFQQNHDIVIIATPDFSHVDDVMRWLGTCQGF